MTGADWIGVDRGPSEWRIWPVGHGGPLGLREGRPKRLDLSGPDDVEPTLLDIAGEFLDPDRQTPVIVCGAGGAPGGRGETPLRALPCTPLGADRAVLVRTRDRCLKVWLLPGLSLARPPAVMHGGATRIAGFLAREADFDGVLCLAGPHTHWVHVSAGEVVSFQSFMTGEMVARTVGRSVLQAVTAQDGVDITAFLDAASDALSRPERFPAGLLPLRAEAILGGIDPVSARSRLMGLMIGAEMAGARPHWLGREVVVIGDPTAAEPYRAALAAQGVQVRTVDRNAMTLAGLTLAHEELK